MSDSDMTLALIEQAVRAPSSHNTQPWLFQVRPGAVELHADRSRALPVNEPHDRELHISCGAALFNLEVAAARTGLGTETALLPAARSLSPREHSGIWKMNLDSPPFKSR
jgi:nitroreductase